MAHDLSPVTINDVARIVRAAPVKLSWLGRGVLAVLVVIGVVAFLQQLVNGDPRHAWMSVHINFTFWFCAAAASTCFAAVFQICNAQWSRPIRRIFESATPFFVWSPAILVVLYLGHHHLFIWAHEEIPGKGVWLTSSFVYARDILGILLLSWLARKVIYNSLRRDIGAIRGGLTGLPDEELQRWQDKRYDRYVTDWGEDSREEIAKSTARMGVFSPLVIMGYAVVMTLIAFDQIMSVDPHWYSTMFGGFYFMTAVYLAVAFAALGVGLLRCMSPLFLAKIERRTLHDLGKLLFGFGIFWAYLFWCHYLPIWYGNLPEETAWIILRMREEPWHSVAWMVLGMSFIIPFLLGLSRDVKQVPVLLFCTAVIVAIGLWLQQYLLFAPTLYPDALPFRLTDLAITFGFLGAYVLSAVGYLRRVPLVPFGDFYLEH